MKRIIVCVCVIAAILALSAGSLFMLKSANEKLYRYIDNCTESYFLDSNDLEERLAELENYWGEYYVKVFFLTRSSSLDDISCSVSRLRYLLEEDSDEFASELNSVRFRAYLIYESQIPYLRSVF
jgi:hypothetical protein